MNCVVDALSLAREADRHEEGELILVVDNDDESRAHICHYLNTMGYRTRGAANAREMWARLDDSVVLVLLEHLLPGEDGLSLCRTLSYQASVSIIMLSAQGSAAERIIGLEMGADDYLCKPFEPRELVARIRAVRRRTTSVHQPKPAAVTERCFSGWCLDLQLRRLRSPQGHAIDLTRSDFMVLKALSETPNRIISRDELSRCAFGRECHINDRAIDVCISRLRHYLEDNARHPRFIRTVRNEGYLLEFSSSAPE
ncbi:winged helix-turn-helix domain-containing protein [Halomonas aquamarina]|uniref:Winged helix-turn-helix domain-containing protein n=1 Tax=Vreelandella aquamarina TaxID=77097 RepID=A0ACC5VV06_9GAMM|nr:response regulator [Halomonas aquamarina]MBZ5487708.1 winged helix-turn-helix domain-containing protein [Halomonas aquamarina]